MYTYIIVYIHVYIYIYIYMSRLLVFHARSFLYISILRSLLVTLEMEIRLESHQLQVQQNP